MNKVYLCSIYTRLIVDLLQIISITNNIMIGCKSSYVKINFKDEIIILSLISYLFES